MVSFCDRKNTFLQICCSHTADDQSEKKSGRFSEKREGKSLQRKTRMFKEIPINKATRIKDMSLLRSDYNRYHEQEKHRPQGRIIYNADRAYARTATLYPSINGDIFGRGNRVRKSYEWQVFLTNKWLPFKNSIGSKLEEIFWCTSRVDRELMRKRLGSNWWRVDSPGKMLTLHYKHYKICPLFMLQRNMKSGSLRQIRRKKINRHFISAEVEKIYPRRSNQYYRYPWNERYKMQNWSTERKSRCDEQKRLIKNRSLIDKKLCAVKKSRGVFKDNTLTRNEQVRENSASSSSPSVLPCKADNFNKHINFKRWSTEDVVNWLRRLNLGMWSRVFEDNCVNGQKLACANQRWLEMDLGIPHDHSKQILNALNELISVNINKYLEMIFFYEEGACRSTTSQSIQTLHSEKSKDSEMPSVIKYHNINQLSDIPSSETGSVKSAEAAMPLNRIEESRDIRYLLENRSLVEKLAKDSKTSQSVQAINNPSNEQESFKNQNAHGSLKTYSETPEKYITATKSLNKTQSIQELNEIYAQFMLEDNTRVLRTDRDTYSVSASEEQKSPTHTEGSSLHLILQTEFETTALTIPPTGEIGSGSSGNNEQKKSPAFAPTYSSVTTSDTSPPETEINLGRNSLKCQEIEIYDNSSNLSDSSSESLRYAQGDGPYQETISPPKYVNKFESVSRSKCTSAYRVARSLAISNPKVEY